MRSRSTLQRLSMRFFCALLTASVGLASTVAKQGISFAASDAIDENVYSVPTGFYIGAGTSAYETEGAWDEDGKGPSIWDQFLHARPKLANGDVACNSYHQFREDIQLAKDINLDVYRLSISWPRIFPEGTTDKVNIEGVNFYNTVISEIVNNNILPMVVLYYDDLPQALQDDGGGWAGNASIQDRFNDYARFAFQTYGDRVKWWITFNDPRRFCTEGYEKGRWPPGVSDPGVGLYKCAHNIILAHAKAYQTYINEFSNQGAEVGISLDITYATPLRPNDTDDEAAATRTMAFNFGWFADPFIFGDYPSEMRNAIDARSVSEGLSVSRLPVFTAAEKSLLSLVPVDFLGLNHYATVAATPGVPSGSGSVSFERDRNVTTSKEKAWKFGPGCSQKTPWGLRSALSWIKGRYNNYPLYVTENGYYGDSTEGVDDDNRIIYLSRYLRATIDALTKDGVNLLGYCVWSLIDNLEWTSGYRPRFGVAFVDYNDAGLKRTLKKSASFLLNVTQTRTVPFYDFDGES